MQLLIIGILLYAVVISILWIKDKMSNTKSVDISYIKAYLPSTIAFDCNDENLQQITFYANLIDEQFMVLKVLSTYSEHSFINVSNVYYYQNKARLKEKEMLIKNKNYSLEKNTTLIFADKENNFYDVTRVMPKSFFTQHNLRLMADDNLETQYARFYPIYVQNWREALTKDKTNALKVENIFGMEIKKEIIVGNQEGKIVYVTINPYDALADSTIAIVNDVANQFSGDMYLVHLDINNPYVDCDSILYGVFISSKDEIDAQKYLVINRKIIMGERLIKARLGDRVNQVTIVNILDFMDKDLIKYNDIAKINEEKQQIYATIDIESIISDIFMMM